MNQYAWIILVIIIIAGIGVYMYSNSEGFGVGQYVKTYYTPSCGYAVMDTKNYSIQCLY